MLLRGRVFCLKVKRGTVLLLSADDFQEPTYSQPNVHPSDDSALLVKSSDITVVQNESYTPNGIGENDTSIETSHNDAYGVVASHIN